MNYKEVTHAGNTEANKRDGKGVAFRCLRQKYADQGHGFA